MGTDTLPGLEVFSHQRSVFPQMVFEAPSTLLSHDSGRKVGNWGGRLRRSSGKAGGESKAWGLSLSAKKVLQFRGSCQQCHILLKGQRR